MVRPSVGEAGPPPRQRRHIDHDTARRAAFELLGAAGITRVILVDDEAITAADSVAVALTDLIYKAKPTALRHVYNDDAFKADDLKADAELRARDIRDYVSRLPPEKAASLLGKLGHEIDKLRDKGTLPPLTPEEKNAASHVLFCGEIQLLLGDRLTTMDPDSWDKEGSRMIERSLGTERDCQIKGLPDTLVLFDVDLSASGRSDVAGQDMAIALIRRLKDHPVLCGLISAMVPSTEEAEQRKAWIAGHSVRAESLVLISKVDLADNPLAFAAELKRVLLAPFADRFSKICKSILEAAHKVAVEQVLAIHVSDLVQSVLLSTEEGVNEIATLLRVYDSYFRQEVRRRVAEAEDLAPALEQLRSISRIAPQAQLPTELTTWDVQRREIYDDIADVNGLELPIEVGDVFEFSMSEGSTSDGGRKTVSYVFVAQPCHAIVRGDGTRKLARATLVRIRDKDQTTSEHGYELPWFGSRGETGFVDFTDTVTIPFEALDLCAFRKDGCSAISLEDTEPDGLLPGWKSRWRIVRGEVEMKVNRARETFAKLVGGTKLFEVPGDRMPVTPLVASVSMSGPVSMTCNMQLTQRIQALHANAILSEYAAYLSRHTFPVDLTRGVTEG